MSLTDATGQTTTTHAFDLDIGKAVNMFIEENGGPFNVRVKAMHNELYGNGPKYGLSVQANDSAVSMVICGDLQDTGS